MYVFKLINGVRTVGLIDDAGNFTPESEHQTIGSTLARMTELNAALDAAKPAADGRPADVYVLVRDGKPVRYWGYQAVASVSPDEELRVPGDEWVRYGPV